MAHLDADEIESPFSDHHGERYFAHLRTRLRWQLLAAHVVPLLVLSVIFHHLYSETLEEKIETHLKSVAEHKRSTVSLYLQERVANTNSAFDFAGLPTPPTTEEMRRALAGLQAESRAFVDVGLFDPAGKLVAYAGPFPHLLGKGYGEQDWYRRLHAGARSYHISDVFMGFRGRPHFIIAVRKEIADQRWTLRTSVDPERFAAFVNSSLLMQQVEAFIVNRQGRRQTLTARRRAPATTAPHVLPQATETSVQAIEHGGRRFLAASAWLAETDWALVVRVPYEIAYAPLRSARIDLAALTAVIVVLIVLVVLRNTARIVGWLQSADRAKEDLRGQLFNAAKLASVGEMAAGVAHEINNPLAIVYEEAGIMRDMLDPELGGDDVDLDDFRERLGAISEATLRGRSVTSKLLAFARQHDPDPEPIDVNQVVDKVLSIKARELELSDIEVDRRFAKRLPEVLINANQIEQVLLNLLNNARDAIEGPGQISLRTKLDGTFVRIDVEDSGCGMTAEQMEKVFFPFFTTKGVGRGTGLGLSISYGIVKALGGRLEVTSEVGVGSTFSIFLPLGRKQRKRRHQHGPSKGATRENDGNPTRLTSA